MAKSEGGGSGRGARRREHWRGRGGAAPQAGKGWGTSTGTEDMKLRWLQVKMGAASGGKDTMNIKLRAQTLEHSAVAN